VVWMCEFERELGVAVAKRRAAIAGEVEAAEQAGALQALRALGVYIHTAPTAPYVCPCAWVRVRGCVWVSVGYV